MAENAMCLVRTTVEHEEQARALARRLVTDNAAACVHVHPIRSWYRWEGKLEEAGDWLVEARVPDELVDATWEAMLRDHPFELPLVEVIGAVRTTAKYAAWARHNMGRASD